MKLDTIRSTPNDHVISLFSFVFILTFCFFSRRVGGKHLFVGLKLSANVHITFKSK